MSSARCTANSANQRPCWTTGDTAKTISILDGVARAASTARTVYIGMIVPEQSAEFGPHIASLYARLETRLRKAGRATRYEPVISPSSATVLRSRLYRLTDVD